MRRNAEASSLGSSPRGGLARNRLLGLACLCVLALGAFLGTGASAVAASGEGCQNEGVRAQSDVNSVTGQPFSVGLPECRAYEMVSPLQKQAQGVRQTSSSSAVSPDGGSVAFNSLGAFSDPNSFNGSGGNNYSSTRGTGGWTTTSSFAPASLIPLQLVTPVDYNLDMSRILACGDYRITPYILTDSYRCAVREVGGQWNATPLFESLNGESPASARYLGASADLSHAVFSSYAPLLTAAGGLPPSGAHQIYEMDGVGGPSPQLHMVSVDDQGRTIGSGTTELPALGGLAGGRQGDLYQAISADGSTVFFTAQPTGGVLTLYARIGGTHTVVVSAPHCTTCTAAEADATYQGASRDGSKAFFLSAQQLVDADTDATTDLYEYDFDNPSGQPLVQVSAGGPGDPTPGAGAEVQGVVRTSQDASHVYFVAKGVLTTVPNGLGQAASSGSDNLYVFERDEAHPLGQTKFVATLPAADSILWEAGDTNRQAQATPDGRYLIFATTARLITGGSEADTDSVADIYRYDSETGGIVRISIGEPSFPASDNGNGEGFAAAISPVAPSSGESAWGAFASVNDMGRDVSETGTTVIFATSEQLQDDDVNGGAPTPCLVQNSVTSDGCDVYMWRNGVVSMISDGQDPHGADDPVTVLTGSPVLGMSSSGDDIFFATHTSLVGQDTDSQQDVYDASVGGGFPYLPATGCAENDSCRDGASTNAPAGTAPASATFTGPGNPPQAPTKKPHKKKHHKKKHHKKKHTKTHKGKLAKKHHPGTQAVDGVAK